eukprot:953360-Pelagomonas_calceolata.AAC.2
MLQPLHEQETQEPGRSTSPGAARVQELHEPRRSTKERKGLYRSTSPGGHDPRRSTSPGAARPRGVHKPPPSAAYEEVQEEPSPPGPHEAMQEEVAARPGASARTLPTQQVTTAQPEGGPVQLQQHQRRRRQSSPLPQQLQRAQQGVARGVEGARHAQQLQQQPGQQAGRTGLGQSRATRTEGGGPWLSEQPQPRPPLQQQQQPMQQAAAMPGNGHRRQQQQQQLQQQQHARQQQQQSSEQSAHDQGAAAQAAKGLTAPRVHHPQHQHLHQAPPQHTPPQPRQQPPQPRQQSGSKGVGAGVPQRLGTMAGVGAERLKG